MTVDYSKLDPGIRVLVWFLQGEGFKTTDSGDGVSKEPDPECVYPAPHVHLHVPQVPGAGGDNYDSGQAILRVGVGVKMCERLHDLFWDDPWFISFDPASYNTPMIVPVIQLMYGFPDQATTVSVFNIDDAMLAHGNPELFASLTKDLKAHMDYQAQASQGLNDDG